MKAGTTSAGKSGFTLVEVIVSLAVLSLILLATVTALRTFANTQQTMTRTISQIDEMRTVSSFLRDQLESSVLGSGSDGLSLGGATEVIPYFRGEAQAIEWKATVKFGESYGGKYLLRVALRGNELVLQWQDVPDRLIDVNWDRAQSRRLIDNLDSFKLAYRTGYGEPWQQDIEQDAIPTAVRMSIQARGRNWPDLVMVVPR